MAELDLATGDHALKFLAQYGRVRIGERSTVVLLPIKLHDVKNAYLEIPFCSVRETV